MALPTNTRLRYVSSKDMDKIIMYFDKLPYRVEMKGLVVNRNVFYQAFILPDDDQLKEVEFGNLD